MSAGFVAWGVEALVASTLLMLAALALRGPVRRAFGPDVAYALWALPLLRLLLPPLPQAWHEAVAQPMQRAGETITIYIAAPLGAAAIAPAGNDLPIAAMIATAWILGAGLFLAWHAIAHLKFCRRMIDRQVRGSQVEGGIHLIETDAASGPLAFGILRRYVAFPRDFVERYDQDERDLALAHELGHHARGDLLANWLALGVLALHWFNPVAWRAFRAFRADQEIANDARVLAGLGPLARHAYACAIVKSAHGPTWGGPVSAACHLHTINDLKGRLKMLTTDKTSRARLLGGAAAVALLGVAALGVTASGTQAAETVRNKVEKATGVNLAQFDVTPPAPPAPGVAQAADLPEPPESANLPPAAPGEDRDIESSTTNADGKVVKRIKVVVRDKHGHVRTEDWRGMDELKNMPEVSSRNCAGGAGKEMVINETKGEMRRIIICTDRIDAAAARGAAMAAQSERMAAQSRRMAAQSERMAANHPRIQYNAMQAALSGLRTARASIEGNLDMTTEQRREALSGIDQAMAEVTAQMSGND